MRLSLAQALCRPLPPILSQRLRSLVYPLGLALRHDYPFTARSLTGSQLRARTGDFHGYPFAVHGYYEWRNLAIALALCKVGDTIIEIGANIGTETIGFADIVGPMGTVHAFEPLPANSDALEQSAALNRDRRIVLHSCAVSSDCGSLRFAVPPRSSSGTGHLLGPSESDGEIVAVKCVTLDSLAAQIGVAKAIFIDAEGAEISILRGVKRYLTEHRPAIVLEASPKLLKRAGSSLEELADLIRELGYEPRQINRFGLTEVGRGTAPHASNWLCTTPGSDSPAAVRKMLLLCGLLPCMRKLNPITRVAS